MPQGLGPDVPSWMPAEGEPHARTFMAWPSRSGPWGADLAAVRRDVAGIARAVADFEPVVLVVDPADVSGARRVCGGAVEVLPIPVDDLWMRDTGPTFVRTPGGLAGVDTNFTGWGGKQACRADGRVARRILEHQGVPRIVAPLVTEGGSLEVDGRGALIATESSIVNDNRNPGRTRAELEADLKALLGVSEVIWFPGVRGADITDGHIDGFVRFTGPGAVVLADPGPWARPEDTALHLAMKEVCAAHGLDVVDLVDPDLDALGPRGDDFLASYINYYVVNGAVIAPAFGDVAADRDAADVLGALHPGRAVVQVRIDVLAEGGGGIHCATQQEPVA
ncbi:agmatine/peptidylarginine deiminase [Umezawaea endophytica]|uniref:Agmatine deiminase family protein n=1 Tax=Umezawaea endophytica TaxID=1654476 RepID=A0A9X2VQ12_9PSEU|nr:agmatine deiminase family protein [Umezawaea endophytica]MCS7480327.1 agmatine deiminase family protein [Umezawaea endophytica]